MSSVFVLVSIEPHLLSMLDAVSMARFTKSLASDQLHVKVIAKSGLPLAGCDARQRSATNGAEDLSVP